MLEPFNQNQRLWSGKEGPHIPMRSGVGLGNTNPIATQGPAFSLRTPAAGRQILEAVGLTVGSPSLGTPALVQFEVWSAQATLLGEGGMSADAEILPRAESEFVAWVTAQVQFEVLSVQATLSGEGGMSPDAEILPRARALKPAGQVILFQKIMQEWDFTDQEAARLLGFDAAADIGEIYLGTKPVPHRDANDRLRAVLRIATDLDDLFREVAAIRDWLSEPQRDLDGATPRSLLTEGSMENLQRIKYYVSYLSGR
jgi:hypothetical protein